MNSKTWYFPQPYNQKRFTQEEEQQLFYNLAKEFSTILSREVVINTGHSIIFDSENGTTVNYSSKMFNLTIKLIRDYEFAFNRYREPVVFICMLYVEPQYLGIGTKLMKLLIRQLSPTSYLRIVLDTGDENSRRFWRRLGFQPPFNSNTPLEWHLPLPK